jgi:predicted nucleic acid-binding protein
MGVIVDSNVFIDAENGRLALENLPLMQTEPVFIAAITVSEMLAGVRLAKTPEQHIRRHSYVENVLGSIPVLDFDTEVARAYAELYAHLLGQGLRSNMNVHDLQIAATALVHGHVVLTTNLDDFKDVPGLRIVSLYAIQNNTIHESAGQYSV